MMLIGSWMLVLVLVGGNTHVYQYQTYDACQAAAYEFVHQPNDVIAAGCARLDKKEQ